KSYDGNGQPSEKRVYISKGDGTGWTEDTNYASTSYPDFENRAAAENLDNGVRIAGNKGHGFPEMNWSGGEDGTGKHVYINKRDGTGWTEDTNYASTSYPYFVTSEGVDLGVRLADINGDGLPDLIESYDGNGAASRKHVYINNGNGTGWTEDTHYASSTYPGFTLQSGASVIDNGVRIADVNGDGFADMIWAGGEDTNQKHVYINKGDGTGWREETNYASTSYPYFSDDQGVDQGVRIVDANGDGLPDLIQSYDGNG